MGYERYRQGQRDPRDFGSDSNDTYSSARDYEAAGNFDRGGSQRGYGNTGYGGGSYGGASQNRDFDRQSSGSYGSNTYRGSYAHDGHRFEDVEDYGREYRRDFGGQGYGRQEYGRQDYGRQDYGRPDYGRQAGRGDYGRQPQGYDSDRGFFDRAGDEVRSWFGDREAERRREQDARYDMQRDDDYRSWRTGQIDALDRDYHEYRQENRTKFQNEFSNWRTERQGQRDSLSKVTEHMEVLGSDGSHVGTVDKVRGDRIVLTKNDQDAGGRHHSIPSRWIQSVDDKVTLRKTADEAKQEWRDEERNQAFFSEGRSDRSIDDDRGAHMLGRSFSGTY